MASFFRAADAELPTSSITVCNREWASGHSSEIGSFVRLDTYLPRGLLSSPRTSAGTGPRCGPPVTKSCGPRPHVALFSRFDSQTGPVGSWSACATTGGGRLSRRGRLKDCRRIHRGREPVRQSDVNLSLTLSRMTETSPSSFQATANQKVALDFPSA